ncbi:cytokinin dehydrogenase 3-like [Olea europaea subsp. europaea]|uniref:cytokinin dehydrogenase n=1 Tax=Olea europaea subsp. europaea TaxID=158383 RepID=A0A8S0SIK6_OLEEU|nr:cytokinin dehydrogenase 3-like [Olea europaea subsp. europaea]
MDFSTYIVLIILSIAYVNRVSIKATMADASSNQFAVRAKLHYDLEAIALASTDYGHIIRDTPFAVLYPTHSDDITELIKFSNKCPLPFNVSARGCGHSVRGQDMAQDGIVVNMLSLKEQHKNGTGITVSTSGHYADVGGEQLWIDVLNATLQYGLAPVSWTDYLYLTVGGTLSNAGVSGQAFLYGPQISNVLEMDVITGKGHFVTCSKDLNSELFFAVLGGLGQFGIINRARIVLAKAPTRVKWVKMLYHDFSIFTRDQEQLISIKGPDYLEGYLMMDYIPVNEWRSPFFTPYNESQISSLLKKYGILYGLEMVKYYDDETANLVDKEVQRLQDGLNYIPGFSFTRDVTYVDFLNRVRQEEIALRSGGLWDVPHPWLNLFVPKSHIMDFNAGVFVDILHSKKMSKGPLLVYPTTKTKWDDRMSAVTPDEDIFYLVGILQAGSFDNWQELDNINNEILEFCNRAGINIKQYLPHYTSEEDWIKHFGSKWNTFRERKARFDPRMILSPGQKVFDSV